MVDQRSQSSEFLLTMPDGQDCPIPSSGLTIGRQADNQVILPDPLVSRRHADLYFRDGRLYVTDLQSANGTRVNGERLTAERVLMDGDTIEVGETKLLIKVRSPQISIILPANRPQADSPRLEEIRTDPRPNAAQVVTTGLGATTPQRLVVQASEPLSTPEGVQARVTLQGVLDIETVGQFREVVDRLVDAQVTRFTIVLESLEFLDSSGLGALVALRRQVAPRSGMVELQHPQPIVREAIELTRLDRIFLLS